ncbi:MAG: 4Fe-4S dicluster domain-containing protein, partial [Candidatus Marinimicrobia bacterium]|nr:4Fe-4S dicluster domain-containing protein [Candidatus Neomarinimicrobiota bacterium]
ALLDKTSAAEHELRNHPLEFNSGFTRDAAFQKRIWNVRKGLYPSVGAVRQSGSTVIIEDIAFNQDDLISATKDVREALDTHGYRDGIIFGHAKDGNLHFVITQEFDREGTQQYNGLIKEIVYLVTEKYNGSLKAEHGTGRNMAPFVRAEWGSALYNMMCKVKESADPENILNPDVIINSNPQAHLSDIKHLPSVHEIIDTCVECGFCESVCPSHDLTTSPRRRIVLWREMERLAAGNSQDQDIAAQIRAEYDYEAVDTCATDGLCALACPVDIDTGKMMKFVRETRHPAASLMRAGWSVEHFSRTTQIIRFALRAAQEIQAIIGRSRFTRIMNWLHEKSGGALPGWNPYFPEAARFTIQSENVQESQPDLIYFPSCLNRHLGDLPGEHSSLPTVRAFEEILKKAGLQFRYPQKMDQLCCGTPWQSKGFTSAYKQMAEKTVRKLWKSTNAGQIPVVMDTSPCTNTMKHYDEILSGNELEQWRALVIYDIMEYLDQIVLHRIQPVKKKQKVVLHPTCSTRKMEHTHVMQSIARRCAEEVHIPLNSNCCGFAGDRGLLYPELTQSATAREGDEIRGITATGGYYSSSRTCEAALSSAAEVSYQSIIQLVHDTLT